MDIVVFPSKYGGGAGRVEIVESARKFETLTSYGQNWNGKGWTNGVAQPGLGPETVRTCHYYDDPNVFYQLNFPDIK